MNRASARGMVNAHRLICVPAKGDMLVNSATVVSAVSTEKTAETSLGRASFVIVMAGVLLVPLCANACQTGLERLAPDVQRTFLGKTATGSATTW